MARIDYGSDWIISLNKLQNQPNSSGTIKMAKNRYTVSEDMTDDRRKLLRDIMQWYWTSGYDRNVMTLREYEFVYDIFASGLSTYGDDVKNKLSSIREKYVNDIRGNNK